MIRAIFFCLLLTSCAAPSPWSVDFIAAGDPAFNSSRLRYHSQSHSPLAFELFKIGNQVEAFLCLSRFRFSPDSAKLVMTIEGETLEETITPHEGLMKVRLSSPIAGRLIQALQEGKKVAILLDGFEETLEPQRFSQSFTQFLGEGNFFNNLLKGPLQ